MAGASQVGQFPSEVALDYTRIPYRLFFDPTIEALEQQRLFQGPVWNYVGLEAELKRPGDFKTTTVGRVPMVVTRTEAGDFRLLVNRCAHRGAMVCNEPRGHRAMLVCPYHQWSYDLAGRLRGVPFRGGAGGRGGYPADFSLADHGLQSARIDSYRGVLFGSFSDAAPPLTAYLGQQACAELDRVFARPLRILGYSRQEIRGNWKLYAENTRDPYHASLLHLFHATFTNHRITAEGGNDTAPFAGHIHSVKGDDAAEAAAYEAQVGARGYRLADPSLMAGRPEFGRRVLSILTVFPNLVVQQIGNTLATRQIVPLAVDRFELLVTYFGYEDDDAELASIRLKQANLIGPAGYISLEDGYAVELVQQAIQGECGAASVIEMGGRATESQDTLATENGLRAFWRTYGRVMGWDGPGAANGSGGATGAD